MGEELLRRASDAYGRASADPNAVPGALLEELAASDTLLARAWVCALRARLAMAARSSLALREDLELPAELVTSPEAAPVVAKALAALERLALVTFDTVRLERCLSVRSQLEGDLDPCHEVQASLARGWLAWLRGERSEPAALEATAGRARAGRWPALVVEVQTLRSLHALSSGDAETATELVRRASRMARTEGIPDAEVLANVALARVRRAQNRPHLSLRILDALLPHAPPAWHAWLHWEAVAAGLASSHVPASSEAAARLAALLHAVGSGDVAATRVCADALASAVRAIAPLERDAQRTLALLVPEHVSSPAQDDVVAWRRGETDDVPRGLAGILFAVAPGHVETGACAHVLLVPGEAARRVPALTIPLATAGGGVDAQPAAPPTQPRTDHGLAVLALSGGAMEASDYFRRVYQYDYDAGVHSTMFGMHVLRMRSRVGSSGALLREAGELALVPSRSLLIRDPRCEEPLPQQALRLLARGGALGARALATALGAPLRTVQRMLADLVVDESLTRVQEGREIVYLVEDTTFSEPTRSRLFGPASLPTQPGGA